MAFKAYNEDNKKYKVGDIVVLKKEHTSMIGTFEAGTEVQIIGYGTRGYDIKDTEGNKMTECGWEL